MTNAVIVIDMVVGFLEPGHNLYIADARNTIGPIQRLLDRETAAGSEILFLCDTHVPNDLEFKMFPVHCVEGTEEPKVIPELDRYPGARIPKRRYSGFFGTDLEQRLAAAAPEKVTVVGVCTNICVLHTTADLRNRDYRVEVPEDCVATFDAEAHRFALDHMKNILGATVIESAKA